MSHRQKCIKCGVYSYYISPTSFYCISCSKFDFKMCKLCNQTFKESQSKSKQYCHKCSVVIKQTQSTIKIQCIKCKALLQLQPGYSYYKCSMCKIIFCCNCQSVVKSIDHINQCNQIIQSDQSLLKRVKLCLTDSIFRQQLIPILEKTEKKNKAQKDSKSPDPKAKQKSKSKERKLKPELIPDKVNSPTILKQQEGWPSEFDFQCRICKVRSKKLSQMFLCGHKCMNCLHITCTCLKNNYI